MYEIIVKALRDLVDFNEEELFLFMQRLKPRTLKKNEHILVAGETCKVMTIIEEGGLRYYTIDENGERSFWFAFEGEWLGDYESFLTRTPSSHYIQAIEDTRLFCLHFEDMQSLYAKGARFERFGRLIAENLFITVAKSKNDLATLSAEQRYLNLVASHPKILQRVAQQHIATYLGIQPQSLSRIRGKLSNANLNKR